METTQTVTPEVTPTPVSAMPKLKGTWLIITEGFNIWKSRLSTLAILSILPYVFIFIVAVIVSLGLFAINGQSGILQAMTAGPTASQFIAMLIIFPILFIAILIFTVWSQASIMYAIADETKSLSTKQLIVHAWPKIKSYIWVFILTELTLAGAALLFVIPAIIIAPMITASLFVFITEDVKGLDAIVKSREYTRGYWWQIVGRSILIGLFGMIFSIGSSLITNGLKLAVGHAHLGTTVTLVLVAIISMVGFVVSLLINTFVFACLYSLFKTLRDTKGSVSIENSSFRKYVKVLPILGLVLIPLLLISVSYAAFRNAREAGLKAEHAQQLQMQLRDPSIGNFANINEAYPKN